MRWTEAEGCGSIGKQLSCEGLEDCAEQQWALDVKHVEAHRTKGEKTATTKERPFMNGCEKAKAYELSKEGPDVDGRQTTTVKAFTSKPLGKELYASIEYAKHFLVQVEEWNDRDEIVPKEQDSWL